MNQRRRPPPPPRGTGAPPRGPKNAPTHYWHHHPYYWEWWWEYYDWDYYDDPYWIYDWDYLTPHQQPAEQVSKTVMPKAYGILKITPLLEFSLLKNVRDKQPSDDEIQSMVTRMVSAMKRYGELDVYQYDEIVTPMKSADQQDKLGE